MLRCPSVAGVLRVLFFAALAVAPAGGALAHGNLATSSLADGVPHAGHAPGGAGAASILPGGSWGASEFLPDLPGMLPVWVPYEPAGGHVTIESGTPWRVLQTSGPVQGNTEFWCPGVDGGIALENGYNTMTMRASCPYRIIDDADLLGSPQIAINPDDPREIAFFSLHGGGTTAGPTPRSRDPSPELTDTVTGLSHTTFTSRDQGRSWFDNPWGQEGYGEHATGVMDRDGNLYIGALWSKPAGDGVFNYVFKIYKHETVRDAVSSYVASKSFVSNDRANETGNVIDQVNLVYVPPKVDSTPQNVSGNQTPQAPADPSQVGNHTNPQNTSEQKDRVVAVWFERALDWRNSTTAKATGKSSWIDAAWTDTTARDNWTRLADKELIGPCMAASNPVAANGKVYVACVADQGYDARSRAKVGDIDVWVLDPVTGKTKLVEHTGLRGGQPHMAARDDGYMAVATSWVRDNDNVDVNIVFGWHGRQWTGEQSVGADVHRLAGDAPMRSARITAMAMTHQKNTLFLSYLERANMTVQQVDPNPTTLPGQADPDQAIEYKKLVFTMNQCGPGLLDVYDLQVGVVRHPFQEGVVGEATGAFDDLQDGMTIYTDEAGTEYVYFAYGDHGVIQYGALVGSSSGSACRVQTVPADLPFPPIPASVGVANPFSAVVGITMGAVSLAMVTYLLSAKRRTAAFTTAKAK